MKSCLDCNHCVTEDHGYSNVTVEGTYVHCSKELHPDGTFDRFYGEEPKLNYADKCEGFEAGECIEVDCEQENEFTEEQSLKIKACGIHLLERKKT